MPTATATQWTHHRAFGTRPAGRSGPDGGPGAGGRRGRPLLCAPVVGLGNTAPANRFVVLTNWNSEAVLDKETGLMWEKSPSVIGDGVLWSAARSHCPGQHNRQPQRLAATVHPRAAEPDRSLLCLLRDQWLPPGHPFLNVQFGTGDPRGGPRYWSATTNADNPTLAWDVRFDIVGVGSASKTAAIDHACVCAGVTMRIRIEASVIGVIGSLGGAEGSGSRWIPRTTQGRIVP